MIIVPDASVILKWVLERDDEPGHAHAMKLQELLLAEEVEFGFRLCGGTKSETCWASRSPGWRLN